ncbi:MAG TPA: hypothetical protein VJM82_06210 [Nitrospiraceae bacterium]|nr:hypothetical protein [Nitrospiraceae bacterium]
MYRFLTEEVYATFQKELLAAPDKGTVIPGCGGLRKIRVRDPRHRKGKRGGARVIYLHVAKANWIYLLDIYGKGEKEELSVAEKRVLKLLAEQFRQEALREGSRKQHKDMQ